jgi:hypothetical protein
MAIDYNSIYNQIQNPQSLREKEEQTQNEALSQIYAAIHGDAVKTEKEPLGYKENIGSIYEEMDKGLPTTNIRKKRSLTELANDEEFATVANRFLESVGSNDNIFEYLRDSEYSLSSAIVRARQANQWTPEQQRDYNYLNQQFKNTELKGFKEHFGLIKDLGGDIVLDPLNWLTLLFALPSGGASFAGKAALGEAARQGAKQLLKQSVKSSKPLAAVTATEGVTWGGLHDYFLQDIAVDTNMIDKIDLNQTAFSGLVGGLAGGILGGGIGTSMAAVQGSKYAKFVEKEFKYTNNSDIDFVGPKVREEVETDYQIDQALNVEETLGPKGEITEETIKQIDKSKAGVASGLNFLFGKSTSEMVQFVEDLPEIGNFLRKLRYDYDVGVLKEGIEGATKAKLADGTESVRTFGEFFGRLQGKYLPALSKALDPIGYDSFFGKLSADGNEALGKLLSNKNISVNNIDTKIVNNSYVYKEIIRKDGKNIIEERTVKVTPDIIKTYKDLRTLLDEGFNDANSVGLFRTGTVLKAGFFPRLYKYDILDKNKDEFADVLINKGHADPINEKDLIDVEVNNPDGTIDVVQGSRKGQLGKDEEIFKDADGNGMNFLELADGDIEVARRLKANKIIDDMLKERFTPFELRIKGKSNANGYLQPRRFTDIEDWEISKFLENDVEVILNNYFTNLSQSIARKKYFGATLSEFNQKELAPIINKMLTAKNKDGSKKYSSDEIKKVQNAMERIFSRATGLDTFSNSQLNKNKYLRKTKDVIILSQQASLLPFATLSSITEPLILLSRAGGADGLNVVNDIGQGIVSQTKSSFDRLWKTIERSTGKTTKGFKDLSDEAWDEIHQTGLAFEQAVMERIEGLAGEAIESPTMKKMQQFFFNSNLLAPWTKAVQLASFNTGKRIIKQHAEKLATGQTAYGKLTAGKRKQIVKELRQLGIDENEAITWYKKSLDGNGNYDDGLAKGIGGNGNDVFYSESMLGGANRFTKEIILNPRAAEANRPDWFGRPDAQFLIQFAGYPTVFNNTILKRFINELSPVERDKNKKFGLKYNEGFGHTAPKVAMTALLMTAVAHVGNEIRSNGKATIDYETGKRKNDRDILADAVRRWGGFGPFDYAYRYRSESDRGVGPGTSVMKAIGGPFPQDILDMVLYRKGFGEMLVTNAPYYGIYDNIFGEGTKKKLRQIAKGTYKKEKERKGPIFKYSKGGIVKNVPNVTDEPDEMQSRVTGIPFNATSEAAQDVEDRELKAQMESLGLREPYVVGGLAKALTKTIKGKQRSSKRLRKDYLNPDYLETLKPKSAKAASESKFNKSAKDVYNLLMDGQITVKEAETYLKDYGYQNETVKKIVRSFKEVGYGLGDDFISYREPYALGGLIRLFHGTGRLFENFDISKAQKGALGKGFYFTDDKKIAQKYTNLTDRDIDRMYGKKYRDEVKQRKAQDTSPSLYEVEANIKPEETILNGKPLVEQNQMVKEKIAMLALNLSKNQRDNIRWNSGNWWRDLIKELDSETDELFPSIGINVIKKDLTKSKLKGKSLGGDIEYNIMEPSILSIINRENL